jgi:hypothetical protein
MATTPTNKPIPSEDPRDLKFNAGKIDEWASSTETEYTDRFSVKRLTAQGMQKVFNDSQDDKESRFESFLLSSGYQFLGDYELGPWQFSERNQYIRYDGQYWRLAPTAPSDFATTGVTASTFEVDKLSLVSMDSDVLRQELAGSDGLKLLGRAASASALRSIEPTEDNQRIETASYAGNLVDGQLIGGSRYEYDKSDNSSYDDGVLTFVTQSGARWKLISGTNTLPIYTTGISGNGGDKGSFIPAAKGIHAINRHWNNGRITKQ